MIKGRDGNRGSSSSSSSSSYSTDLLVCFPPRTHLALTPKPISSPSRPSDSTNRRPHHRRQLSKLSGGRGGGHGSPALWAKQVTIKNMGGEEQGEPTSPKVTCAGQIKVRPSKCGGKGKNWRSVMEEIERIHSSKPQSKFLGVKKDVMSFLTCLKNIRLDLRCFGDFRHADVITSDEDDDEEEEEEEGEDQETAFSKWFMVLQEEQSKNEEGKDKNYKCALENSNAEPAVPPRNALLLMRCRSAPAKSWLEERMKVKTEEENRVKQEEETEETEEENRVKQQKEAEETEEENRVKQQEETEETEGKNRVKQQEEADETEEVNRVKQEEETEEENRVKQEEETEEENRVKQQQEAEETVEENRVKQQEETEEVNRVKQQEETEETEDSMKKAETEYQEMSMKKDMRSLVEEEKMKVVLMRYDTEYYRLSSDIAKETWVVGGVQDPLSRSWRS